MGQYAEIIDGDEETAPVCARRYLTIFIHTGVTQFTDTIDLNLVFNAPITFECGAHNQSGSQRKSATVRGESLSRQSDLVRR